jgi:hypothetical protein
MYQVFFIRHSVHIVVYRVQPSTFGKTKKTLGKHKNTQYTLLPDYGLMVFPFMPSVPLQKHSVENMHSVERTLYRVFLP